MLVFKYLLLLFLRDVDNEVQKSQGPMLNPLTVKCMQMDISGDGGGETSGTFGTKRRTYNKPDNADKIKEPKHRNFSVRGKKKIRWCVSMYEDWRHDRMLEPLHSIAN